MVNINTSVTVDANAIKLESIPIAIPEGTCVIGATATVGHSSMQATVRNLSDTLINIVLKSYYAAESTVTVRLYVLYMPTL